MVFHTKIYCKSLCIMHYYNIYIKLQHTKICIKQKNLLLLIRTLLWNLWNIQIQIPTILSIEWTLGPYTLTIWNVFGFGFFLLDLGHMERAPRSGYYEHYMFLRPSLIFWPLTVDLLSTIVINCEPISVYKVPNNMTWSYFLCVVAVSMIYYFGNLHRVHTHSLSLSLSLYIYIYIYYL